MRAGVADPAIPARRPADLFHDFRYIRRNTWVLGLHSGFEILLRTSSTMLTRRRMEQDLQHSCAAGVTICWSLVHDDAWFRARAFAQTLFVYKHGNDTARSRIMFQYQPSCFVLRSFTRCRWLEEPQCRPGQGSPLSCCKSHSALTAHHEDNKSRPWWFAVLFGAICGGKVRDPTENCPVTAVCSMLLKCLVPSYTNDFAWAFGAA